MTSLTRFASLLGLAVALSACGGSNAAPAASSTAPAVKPTASASAPAASSAKPVSSAAATPVSSGSAATSPAPLNPPVNIKVGVVGIEADAGMDLAIERGYFKDEGLNVTLQRFPGGPDQFAPLVAGDIQLATGTPTSAFFNAVARDVNMRIIAPQAQFQPGDDANAGLIVRKDLVDSGKYKGPSDLKGLTVGVSGLGEAGELYADRAAAKGNVNPKDMSLQVLNPPAVVAAIANKKIDAAWQYEPFISVSKDQGSAVLSVPVGDIITAPSNPSVILVGAKFAAQQPEAVKRLVTAHLRGQRDYYNAFFKGQGDKNAIIQVLVKYTAISDPSTWAKMALHHVDPNGALDTKELQAFSDFYVSKGTQKQEMDVTKVIDSTYMDYALQRLGRMS